MANAHLSEPAYKVVVEKNQVMRTRDGVCLRADVYPPDAPRRFPVRVLHYHHVAARWKRRSRRIFLTAS